MPEYIVTLELQDAQGRRGRKRYLTQSGTVDHVAAVTAAVSLAVDFTALSELEILAHTVSLRTIYADSPVAGANIDEGATFSLNKTDNYKASHKIPGPVAAVRNTDGTIDITNALVTDYFDNFLVTGDFTVSDGEIIDGILGGTLDV